MSLLFLMLSSTSCCDKNKDGQTCGLNMIYYDDSCGCDNNSVPNNQGCTYLAPGLGYMLQNVSNLNRSISTNCSDWRDSLIIGYGDMSMGAFVVVFGDNNSSNSSAMPSSFSYFSFANYDSISFPYFDMTFDYPRRLEVTMGVRMTKSRDTMWARINQVSTMPFTVLDTCDVVLTKIR